MQLRTMKHQVGREDEGHVKKPKGYIKTAEEIRYIQKAGAVLAECHAQIARMMKPGITTLQVNDFAEQFIERKGAKQVTKGYKGFPYATCASVNDVVVHGFPSSEPLRSGDIVTIDIVCSYRGWMADSARTYMIGEVSPQARKLVRVTKECLELGLSKAKAGNRIGDVMYPIQQHAEKAGFSVVRELTGHGIGRKLHEAPIFPHIGKPGQGFLLKEGMVLTIEPMINQGGPSIYLEEDGWTIRTWDGSLSAQFEHTIVITKQGPMILT
jgi:methionyl aminopeptidase